MMNFKGKLCLAPMVRSGELPMRLSALRNGADIVWTPELVDKKLIQTTRVINSKINTVDYVYINEKQKKNSLVFRTYPEEENSKIILQLGSSDPELAVAASLKVIDDVNGIDLNCGCPKNFSTHSGMGAALLSTPDLLCSILSNLVNRVGKPHGKSISCKIRLLDDYKSTISLIDKICETGITNLTIHCRRRDMRNRQDVIWHYLPDIIPRIQAKGISVIINGGLLSNVDFRNMRSLLSQDVGGMIAEAAESNPTIFNKDGPSLQHEVVSNFLSLCKIYNYDCFPNSKYMLLNQIPGKSPYYGKIAKCKTYDDIENVLNDSENFKSDKFLSKIYIKDLQQNK
ncbi:dihydrouridine synthase-domain-containing protein, partial [Scheffersomyces amazonensis]|uniref:dihydrouridine synthase-domain-containing protein n=1 Tax=Scheffersomyces amazonensis TaxID=1078765 RepID=UPI00315C6EF6